ncbi:beta-L-arabinofuranosidase domain-containing protein [Pseudarcicella hirudinis]|uniref:beta-L-arabinofuranosidase domain-containing protein n=1 Tax=Pseudarcicella hirudinis TaxID=1079859 RepID=UPI0035EAC8CB
MGLTRNYELDGLGDSDTIAKFFWDTVIEHHTFATGSNSDKEHFFKPDELSKHLTGYTGETCNVYNMLKLTKHLFTHTREMKYIEYYEKALFNHILGQQDPATGMVSYFLPMLAGAHKVYSTPENSFWCCVGSGFENHAKYGESIYYHDDNGVFINLFIASQLNWKEKGLTLQQETSFPASGQTRFIITTAPTQPLALHFRFPSWAKSMSVLLNGKPQKIKTSAGSYSTLSRIWKPNDIVEISFPMELQLKATNDNSSKVSITYGPIVLAGKQGSVQMESPAPYSDPNKYNDYYTYQYNVPANIVTKLDINNQNIAESIEAMADQPLTFKAKKEGIILQPLYNIHHERYVVYWDLK